MSGNIKNKSNHPVEVKRISLSVWTLRQEIEATIHARHEKDGENADISDIKAFYENLTLNNYDNPSEGDEEVTADEKSSEDTEEKTDEKEEAASASEEDKAEESEEKQDEQNSPDFAVSLPKELNEGFSFLADVNMDEILFFSKEKYKYGQTIAVRFEIPKSFTVFAEVLKTVDTISQGKIISDSKPKCRIRAIFKFYRPDDKEKLRKFLISIEPERPAVIQKIKPQTAEADDSGLDEFEDLDL